MEGFVSNQSALYCTGAVNNPFRTSALVTALANRYKFLFETE